MKRFKCHRYFVIYIYTHTHSLIWYAMKLKKKKKDPFRLSPTSVSDPGNESTCLLGSLFKNLPIKI